MASLPPMSSGDSASQELLIASFMRNRRVELYLPFIIGVWLDAVCLRLLVVTFGSWLTTVRQTDRPLVRYLVFYLMGVSTLMSGFMMAHWFVVYILAWGQFTKLFDTTILRVVPTFFVVTRVPAAFFFAVRAYNVLKQPKWLPCVLAPLFLTCLVSGFIGTAFFTSIPARQLVLNCILIYASTEVASDVIITSSIFYGLWKSKTGWAHTDKVISHLLMLLVETQTPPAIFAIAFLIVSIYKGDGTALGYFVCMPKIHVLCMMLGVNSRVSVAKRMNSSAAPYSSLSNASAHGPTSSNDHSRPRAPSAALPVRQSMTPKEAEDCVIRTPNATRIENQA